MDNLTKKEVAQKLNHHIWCYGHTNSVSDREHLAKIFYYAGLLSGEYLV